MRLINLVDGRTVVFKTKEGEIVSPGAVRKLPVSGGGGGCGGVCGSTTVSLSLGLWMCLWV